MFNSIKARAADISKPFPLIAVEVLESLTGPLPPCIQYACGVCVWCCDCLTVLRCNRESLRSETTNKYAERMKAGAELLGAVAGKARIDLSPVWGHLIEASNQIGGQVSYWGKTYRCGHRAAIEGANDAAAMVLKLLEDRPPGMTDVGILRRIRFGHPPDTQQLSERIVAEAVRAATLLPSKEDSKPDRKADKVPRNPLVTRLLSLIDKYSNTHGKKTELANQVAREFLEEKREKPPSPSEVTSLAKTLLREARRYK